jgi:hypothetical protein
MGFTSSAKLGAQLVGKSRELNSDCTRESEEELLDIEFRQQVVLYHTCHELQGARVIIPS